MLAGGFTWNIGLFRGGCHILTGHVICETHNDDDQWTIFNYFHQIISSFLIQKLNLWFLSVTWPCCVQQRAALEQRSQWRWWKRPTPSCADRCVRFRASCCRLQPRHCPDTRCCPATVTQDWQPLTWSAAGRSWLMFHDTDTVAWTEEKIKRKTYILEMWWFMFVKENLQIKLVIKKSTINRLVLHTTMEPHIYSIYE